MKIALCQLNAIIGDLNYNKIKILEGYKRGVKAGADLVICPELSLVGYPPRDLVEKSEFRSAVKSKIQETASETNKVGLIFGAITEDNDLVGTNIHNSAILCFDGEIKYIQNKSLIPNYDVFDEMRYYESAKDVGIFNFKGENLGISICEDIWNDEDYWYRRRYSEDPVKKLIEKGASLLINISASPYAYGKREERRKMLSLVCKNNNIPLAYVCCAGAQTDLIFDGASMCFNNRGGLVKLGKNYQEDFFIFDTEREEELNIITEGSFEEEVLSSLIFGVKEYCEKLNFNEVILGLSGGLDSAIVTYIAVRALGNKNVHVVMMPSKYSNKTSVTDSEKLINNFKISNNNISIQPVVDKLIEMLSPSLNNNLIGITEENLQARTRGVYLMAFANNNNYLLLSTGNKSEMAVGYCTLYGDMNGGLAVLADVYKTDLYKIANYINRDEEIIPHNIIKKKPSAELKPNQTDQDTLPPYELLDNILRMYLEENKEFEQITSIIDDEETVKNVLRLVDMNEFKRNQSPPSLKVSRKAFGYGRRFPIVQGWRS
ncbi:MAG: NAD+ synthase [Ignavibacteria bacterium]|nr:NAD+ synthase [Ignavibacteria bacterium]